jgi:hypothetical protein
MPIDPEFYELMPSLILVRRYQGKDGFGNSLFGAAESIRCRIDNNARNMGNTHRGGTTVSSTSLTTTIYCDYTTPPFTIRDKLTMPDGSQPNISSAVVHNDENGPYHQVLTCETTRE